MEYGHRSVLAREAVDGLAIKPDGTYMDGTLGRGGHAKLICAQLGASGTLLGIDLDADAIRDSTARLSEYGCRKVFARGNFADVRQIMDDCGIDALDGAILDLGVSSPQLDDPARGFSYMQDGPLDMRMGSGNESAAGDALTAYAVVNKYSENELTRIIRSYGEERWASRIAGFIVRARSRQPITGTLELAEIIKSAIPAAARREGPQPAKRTFQAIRIEVNGELDSLRRGMEEIIDALAVGGRLAVITFHSLEDRIVKEAFRRRENPCTCPPGIPECVCGNIADIRRITKKPIVPQEDEVDGNPRSRSAKLRIGEKI